MQAAGLFEGEVNAQFEVLVRRLAYERRHVPCGSEGFLKLANIRTVKLVAFAIGVVNIMLPIPKNLTIIISLTGSLILGFLRDLKKRVKSRS